MKLLAIETSTPGASVALVEDRATVSTASRFDLWLNVWPMPRSVVQSV